ncbi:hypothetical protein Q7C36_012806 [Tachysurus vachellii]|uniref:Uncharacterized protein n=1 Tax=Tachysurus vachellii TaxID=175792 RepID=A0AA88MQ40_TACVA|nr:hypothetical protein Q7C36_012806 [Tachysurus vachellii]
MRQYLMLFLVFPMLDVSLSLQIPCRVNLEEGVEYQKITWYKVSVGSSSLVGLVRKNLRTNTTELYKFANHSYQIGNDLSLLHVPEHSQLECETYRCSVWPTIGHRILESDYNLPQSCKKNTVEKTEISSLLQVTQEVQSDHLQWSLIATVVVLSVLSVTAVVCLCKQRKTYKSVNLPVSV